MMVMINDGVEELRGIDVPQNARMEGEESVKTFADTCSRILVSNPDGLASLADPDIAALRAIASAEYFVFRGKIAKFPEGFKRKPRAGFVNTTWTNPSNAYDELEEF